MLVTALAIYDPDLIPNAEKLIDFTRGQKCLLRAFRVRPKVAETLGGEQGARRNTSLYRVLIDRQLIYVTDVVLKLGLKPEWEVLGDGSDILTLVRLEPIAACSAAAGV